MRLFLWSGFHASFQNLCKSSQILQLVGVCRLIHTHELVKGDIWWLIPEWSYVEVEATICFTVPGLLACGELRSHGAYVKYHGYKTTSILLIIFSVSLFYILQPAVILLNCVFTFSSLIPGPRLTKKPWPNMKSHKPYSRPFSPTAITNNSSNILDMWLPWTRLLSVLARQLFLSLTWKVLVQRSW